jgi:hypothetical protein
VDGNRRKILGPMVVVSFGTDTTTDPIECLTTAGDCKPLAYLLCDL